MNPIVSRLQEILAAGSPFSPSDLSNDTPLEDLGMSSLQIQIAAAQVEAAFDFRFDEGELGDIRLFSDLVAAVTRHRALE